MGSLMEIIPNIRQTLHHWLHLALGAGSNPLQLYNHVLNNEELKPTLGMLTRDQKSSRCSLIFSGFNLEYNIANSVNIPMCARSKPEQIQIHFSYKP